MKTITLTQSGDYRYELTQPGDEINVIGRFNVSGTEKININLTIIHLAPHTTAKTSIKAVVSGRGSVSLTGLIVVKAEAQDTNSFLEERILLLSTDAKAEAIPKLEIEANDVKCSHAATIGQIDEDQIFYLQSRGIGIDQAKQLISAAFLGV